MTPLPASAVRLNATEAGALAALLAGARTVREVAATVDRSVSVTHRALLRLRGLELAAWTTGREGTLHAAVEVVR